MCTNPRLCRCAAAIALCVVAVASSTIRTAAAAATTSAEGEAEGKAVRERVVRLWREAGGEAKLDPQFVETTARLTEQACAKVAEPRLPRADADVRASLDNLIKTTASRVSAREPSGSYWVAYCIAEALARPTADDPEKAARVVDEHLKLFDEATVNLSGALLERIPPDRRDGWAKKVDEGKATLRATLTSRIASLQQDVLFPAFKRPLNEKTKAAINRQLKLEVAFPEFRNTEDLRNVDLLVQSGVANLFRVAGDLSLYHLSAPQIDARLTPNRYWGYMLFRAGIVYQSAWPISVSLKPDNEMNNAWKDYLPSIMK